MAAEELPFGDHIRMDIVMIILAHEAKTYRHRERLFIE